MVNVFAIVSKPACTAPLALRTVLFDGARHYTHVKEACATKAPGLGLARNSTSQTVAVTLQLPARGPCSTLASYCLGGESGYCTVALADPTYAYCSSFRVPIAAAPATALGTGDALAPGSSSGGGGSGSVAARLYHVESASDVADAMRKKSSGGSKTGSKAGGSSGSGNKHSPPQSRSRQAPKRSSSSSSKP